MHDFWIAISEALGRTFGSALALVIQVLIYLLVSYVLWGLLWDRILTKLGYTGKAFWYRFALLYVPVLVGPLSQGSSFEREIGIAAGIGIYIGLISVAFFPWKRRQSG